MRKKVFLRGLLGFPLGITIGYIITICISLGWGQGKYVPCLPEFAAEMGSEINAVMVQTVLCGLLGASFSASSVIWEMDKWSIAKQTFIYFLITAFTMLPIAYLANWMERSLIGFLSYFGIFVLIFIIVWIVQYFVWKSKIKKLNAMVMDNEKNK